MSSKNLLSMALTAAAAFLSFVVHADDTQAGVFELAKDNDLVIKATPAENVMYGLNGGNLTISGADVVVTQNIPADNTMAGISFGDYWPWIEGTVTVENGATLTSDTQLFRGSNVAEDENKTKVRKLVVRSGAKVRFVPEGNRVDIISLENASVENAWVVVEGAGSSLVLPKDTYLANKSSKPAHYGKLEVLNGALVEGGSLYPGFRTGHVILTVDGGTLRFTGGISFYKDNREWPTSIVKFKNCTVEVPFYKVYYPYLNHNSSAEFDGALFRPIGTSAAKFIDASPVGDPRCPHILTGAGLIVEAPENITLEVAAKFDGDGGFTKRGAGTVVLSANNEYTGTTKVESGKLEITGSLSGALAVSAGAEAVFSSVPVLPAMSIAEGGRVSVVGYGAAAI